MGERSGERRQPTHILRVEVPLYVRDSPLDYDVFRDALNLVVGCSRIAYDQHICDDIMISVEPAPSDTARKGESSPESQ